MMRSTHHLYDFPVVPDGTAQNHAEDHSYDLQKKKIEIIKQFKTFCCEPLSNLYLQIITITPATPTPMYPIT